MADYDLTVEAYHRLREADRVRWDAFARAHGVDPDDTFRIVVSGDTVTFHRHARNTNGNFYLDERTNEPATLEPLIVTRKASVPA